MAKMTDAALLALLASRRGAASISNVDGDSLSRREALKFYRGDPLGNEEPGMSSVVSRDTMEAVESMLPGLLRPFVSGDETVRFEPTGAEDEDAAKQATEFVNYIFHAKNDGFRILYDMMKDGLLFRQGIGKATWEVTTAKTSENYEGLDEVTLQILETDPDLVLGEIVQALDTGLYSVKGVRSSDKGEVKIGVVPPDEFRYEKQLACLDDATFLEHRCRRTIADLIEMGLPKDKCLDLSDDDGVSIGGERADRFRSEGGLVGDTGAVDELSRHVWISESYIKCDYDGDGAVEWRCVYTGGNDDVILSNEECDGHPFFHWTPIPVPHKLVGLSIHDQVRDIQLVKTGIMREVQNGMYLANRPMREVVSDKVNIDDLLTPRIGGVVRVKEANSVKNLTQPFDVGTSMAVIEYYDGVRESRTGSTRYNQGMDADSLNKTATGMSIIANASHAREELIARQFAQGLKGGFKRILELVCKHQDKAETIRLRGEWVQMDPREWKDSYDMSVSVGLGTGDRQQQIANLQNLIAMDAQIVQLQEGANGPLLTMPNIYEKMKRLVEAMGLKGVENYYTDPAVQQEQPDAPDPAAAAQDAEREQMAMQMQADAQDKEANRQVEIAKAQLKAQTDIEVARMNNETAFLIAAQQQVEPAEAAEPAEPAEAAPVADDGTQNEIAALRTQVSGLAAMLGQIIRPKVHTVNRDPETGFVASIEESDA